MCALLFAKSPVQGKQAPCTDDALQGAVTVRSFPARPRSVQAYRCPVGVVLCFGLHDTLAGDSGVFESPALSGAAPRQHPGRSQSAQSSARYRTARRAGVGAS
jgi:hypothetical protein